MILPKIYIKNFDFPFLSKTIKTLYKYEPLTIKRYILNIKRNSIMYKLLQTLCEILVGIQPFI